MPWVKIDDQFQDHPKFLDLSLAAIGLWTAGLAYCSRYLTDGIIPDSARRRLNGTPRNVEELVSAGLWIPLHDGGWLVHDYLDFNPSSEQVRDVREKRAEAGRRGGEARGEQKKTEAKSKQIAKQVADPLLSPRPVPSPLTEVSELKASMSSSTADDDDQQFASEALTLVGRRKHLRAVEAGRVNGNADSHERTCIANAIAEGTAEARTWHAAHPGCTVAELVDHLDPPRSNGRVKGRQSTADMLGLEKGR